MTDKADYPEDIVKKLFFDFDKSELIIIKAHLFIEYSLNKFIEANNKSQTEFEKMNFTFSHKLNICKILGLFNMHSDLETYITDLNRLRNQIAHKHKFEDELYDKIVNFPDSFNSQTRWKTKGDFRESIMAIKSSFMCGIIMQKTDDIVKNITVNSESKPKTENEKTSS
jgi:hypothetical protein